MLIFGLTGGSGAGKSTASKRFVENGVYVIDADKTARAVVEPNMPCLAELRAEFGDAIIREDGSLDRKGLGSIVFADKAKLARLNEITHKYIQRAVEEELEREQPEYAAIDAAVIIGSPMEKMCEFMVSVVADEDVRAQRIMKRDNISYEDAIKRLKSQPDKEFYIAKSRFLLYNNSSEENLREQTDRICETIKESKR